ncbi:hypothetical protein HPB52_003426 [Rhipicephalus sanguineus]|uniref:Uncharacterized protein n=1 Tax=Rhipicephalus sanguineus TaxID=34632 RepID=A0A9D4PHQ2_RHISA|nr:hypothetical protein HPB52_003426 [Rhipicephalus sanguineus]
MKLGQSPPDYAYDLLCEKHLRKGNVSVDEDAQIVRVIDAKTSDVITYDNEDTLRSKLCTMKGNYTKLHYGVAVYDVDHDDFANNCIGQSRYESYSRLKMVTKLNEFFRSYLTAADRENCLKME